MSSSDRLDGWKAIGIYLGRERTTAIRWARTRGLPVHRVPGGKRATVYALKSELDQWVSSGAALNDEEAAPELVAEAGEQDAPAEAERLTSATHGRRWLLTVAAALLVAVLLSAGVWTFTSLGAAAHTGASGLPRDPQVARLYLQARDEWAQRSSENLARSNQRLIEVTQREPDFVPAYAALADTYLLAREFGTMGDLEAFTRARRAVETALNLDPENASALRAKAFILYWWDRDVVAAGETFRTAIELAPEDAQTHFWYGNVLADNGEFAAAMRELDRARLIDPGSLALQTDMAWALWQSGRTKEARAQLEGIAKAHSDYAGVYDCLAELKLAQGDLVGYVAALGDFASLRRDKKLMGEVDQLQSRSRNAQAGLNGALVDLALKTSTEGDRPDLSWAAIVASHAGDQVRLVNLLRMASQRQEHWGNAGHRLRMLARWKDQPEIVRLLRERQGPFMEQ